MPSAPQEAPERPVRLSLVAVHDAYLWPVSGIYEVLTSLTDVGGFFEGKVSPPPFEVEIVAPSNSVSHAASGLPLAPQRTLREVASTDIAVVPSMFVSEEGWMRGRHTEVVEWLREMHRGGARLCSACSGALLLAETGLLDGLEATVHWAFESTFRRNFPGVTLRLERVLVVSGNRREFVMSGASAGWHDLLLYLVASHLGANVARQIGKFLLLQWHPHGQAPYITFQPAGDHGDEVVRKLQNWVQANLATDNPVEAMCRIADMPGRSFIRRFKRATGHGPLEYVQRLRVEQAKHLLECTRRSIDDVGADVGYDNAAFFRRLFKRVTGVSPSMYRQRFRLPDYDYGRGGV